MVGIPLHLRGMSLVRGDEQPDRPAAQALRRRVMQRPARNDFLGLARIGKDLLSRLLEASRRARKRERRAEKLHELAPRRAADLVRAGRKLSLHREAAVALGETSPLRPGRAALVSRTDDGQLQRWHVEQLVRVFTWYSALRRSPNASCSFSPPGVKVMLVTSSRGRR